MKKFQYGFFEMRFKLPQLLSWENNSGVGSNFWLNWHDEDPDFNSYSEIDIMEILDRCQRSQIPSHNTHFQDSLWDDPIGEFADGCICGCPNYPPSLDDGQFHRVAVAWTPNRIDYFIDDIPTHSSFHYPDKMIPMRIFIDFNVFTASEMPVATTRFPYEYTIDYVKVYALNMDKCHSSYNACALQPVAPSVYKDIRFGGACAPTLSAGQAKTVRASGSITLDGEFTAEPGATLTMDIVPCHSQTRIDCDPNSCVECK